MDDWEIKVAQQAPEVVLRLLGSRQDGLADIEVGNRRRQFGTNRIAAAPRETIGLALLREFTHFFAIILWLAAALSFMAELYQPDQGMARLGLAIIVVIIINGVFSFWQAYRAEQALLALCRLLPQRVKVRRGGGVQEIDASELVPGDIVLLTEGAKVPADCRILEGWGVRVNLATLTGESSPRARSAEYDSPQGKNPLTARSLLLAGTLVVAGECIAVVYATGMNTEFGRIAHLTQTVGGNESPLQKEIRRVSHLVALIALILGALFFLIGLAVGLPFWGNAMFSIGIIVANVPEGLLPTVTLSLALATQRMARRNALVRHLPAVETLGSASVILTDKTGTLTQNSMTVRESFVAGQHQLTSKRWPRSRDLHLRAVARFCHSLKFVDGQPVGDPMEIALWQFAGKIPELGHWVGEIPFDAERRRMSVITRADDGGGFLWCKGAPEVVMPLCTDWSAGEHSRRLDSDAAAMFRRAHEDMAARGLRVLALAWKPLSADDGIRSSKERGLELCGLIGLDDPPRQDVHEAVGRCHSAGLRVIILTGDHPSTAVALARQIDVIRRPDPVIVTGDKMRDMSQSALQQVLDAPEILFARVTAEQKMLVVQALQRKGEIVAVTGDGVNDAPALKTADIGIAMGLSGTDVAREAADIVLLDDHFATIVNAIEEGRAVFENIRKFLTYILTSNIPELVPYLLFVLFKIPLPLTVIQILAVDLGTDILPALALGAEKPRPDVMSKPPRPPGEHLLSWPLLARAYLFLGPLEALGALMVYFHVLHLGGWQYGETLSPDNRLYLMATTACFFTIVLAQMANVFVCRHPSLPTWRFPLIENRLLVVALIAEAVLLLFIVYHPWGNFAFGTVPLGLKVWIYALPFALLIAFAEETRKWVRGRLTHGAASLGLRDGEG